MIPLLPLILVLATAGDSSTEFENDYVRVVRVRYAANQKTEVHDYPALATVYVYVTDGGRLRLGHDGTEPTVRPPLGSRLEVYLFQTGRVSRWSRFGWS